ncbi:pantoate--beta-alanine ligase [Virgisporangium aurantiacum]|uniref:Pantothenate synthetase n=1 Tax=Virgisporangium aurantiacum TaxID=175570 RepID=A0A8J4DWZ9_9ACTN|nr:pantoate--beta-alanine ligase [Virgisporangium aurantiacum]GIJ54040.1 pantothenate synthetase [Virgisporangium aurantiacum]
MIVATTREELAKARQDLSGRVAVVPTMGALHAGHVSLLKAARSGADHVIMTLFVNPLQFGPNEDLATYPRTWARDLAIAEAEGVDVIFAPAEAEMYPNGAPAVRIDPGPLGGILEGASRPGFFHGVLTVVLKLLHLTRPDAAFFGEKDYQQLTLVRAMVRDLDLGVDIVGVPTVREPDGLALSSRNTYLSAEQRVTALALSRALAAAAAVGGQGAAAARAAAGEVFEGTPGASLDYVVVTDPDLGPAPEQGPARMLIAARVGTTRLIDNAALRL